MEPLGWVFMAIAGIGLLVLLAAGAVFMYVAWWGIIPLLGLWFGGFLGLLFGLGLTVIIGLVVLSWKS